MPPLTRHSPIQASTQNATGIEFGRPLVSATGPKFEQGRAPRIWDLNPIFLINSKSCVFGFDASLLEFMGQTISIYHENQKNIPNSGKAGEPSIESGQESCLEKFRKRLGKGGCKHIGAKQIGDFLKRDCS